MTSDEAKIFDRAMCHGRVEGTDFLDSWGNASMCSIGGKPCGLTLWLLLRKSGCSYWFCKKHLPNKYDRRQYQTLLDQDESNWFLVTIHDLVNRRYPETVEEIRQKLYPRQTKKGGKMSLILFKDGDQMGIQTDCTTEDEFTISFASAIENLIAEEKFEDDWAFQLERWLKQFAEIVCAYRGYRATEVRKSTVLSVGNTNPQDAAFKELAGEQNRPVLEGFIKHVNGEAKPS